MALEDVRDTEATQVTQVTQATQATQAQEDEKKIVKRVGVFRFMLRGLLWPFSFVVRASRGLWMVLGFRRPADTVLGEPQHVSSPGRQSLTGRKRLHRVTRVLLVLLPRWLQSALGYPVSSSIGRCLSPEVGVSPTKPCGKGSKRKQDELDEDSTDEEHPTWVEALNQECADDEGPEQDPDYEVGKSRNYLLQTNVLGSNVSIPKPTTVETASEEYCSQNDTEEDVPVEQLSS